MRYDNWRTVLTNTSKEINLLTSNSVTRINHIVANYDKIERDQLKATVSKLIDSLLRLKQQVNKALVMKIVPQKTLRNGIELNLIGGIDSAVNMVLIDLLDKLEKSEDTNPGDLINTHHMHILSMLSSYLELSNDINSLVNFGYSDSCSSVPFYMCGYDINAKESHSAYKEHSNYILSIDSCFDAVALNFITTLYNKHNDVGKPFRTLFATYDYSQCVANNFKEYVNSLNNKRVEPELFAIYNQDMDIKINQRNILDRVAIGDIDSVISSSGIFDVAYCRYILDFVDHTNNGVSPVKTDSAALSYLKRIFRYIKEDGYLMYVIPKCCIDNTIIKEISLNGTIENVYKVHCDHDNDIGNTPFDMLLMVIKKNTLNKNIEEAYRNMFNDFLLYNKYDNSAIDISKVNNDNIEVSNISIMPKDISDYMNSTVNTVRVFRGAASDIVQLVSVIKNSGAYNDRPKDFEVTPRPLLPFTKGQIGQVLASGKLDGIIDEGNGHKHVIKGKVIKKTNNLPTKIERVPGNELSLIETSVRRTSNSVCISLFTPSGVIKHLSV